MDGEIYIIKNNINNKVYIGQTTQGSKIRFKQHLKLLKCNQNQLIHKAIKKHGKENFYYEVLEFNIDISYLDNREEYWIDYYNSFKNGYNLCAGGKQSRKKCNQELLNNLDCIIDEYKTLDISLRKLAEKYNTNHHTLSELLKKNKIDIVKRNKFVTNLAESEKIQISDMFLDGLEANEIANILGRNVKTIRRYKNYKCCA